MEIINKVHKLKIYNTVINYVIYDRCYKNRIEKRI